MTKGAEKYPLALAALARFAAAAPAPSQATSTAASTNAPPAAFTVGNAVFRPPPEVARPPDVPDALEDTGPDSTDAMLGELVDMVFVSAEETGAPGSGQHEVHLVFKAEVLGGLHMKLKRGPDGMHATFVVEDAAARRAVVDHVEQLVDHLKTRGFTIVGHSIEIAP